MLRCPGSVGTILLATMCCPAIVPSCLAQDAGGDPIAVGAPIVDSPTFRHLAFRWPYSGDVDGDAVVSAIARSLPAGPWGSEVPLVRIRARGDRWLFAGSLLGLAPGTTYEVRLVASDPDGGGATESRIVSTRATRHFRGSGPTFQVYPDDWVGAKRGPRFDSLAEAFRDARPGDTVEIHPGTYPGPFPLAATGHERAPVTFRGVGDGEAVLSIGRDDVRAVVKSVRGSSHVHIENLHFRGGRAGIRGARNSGDWVVRGNTFEGGGIECGLESWHVVDNTLLGRYEEWDVRTNVPGGVGVVAAGRGHVIEGNRIAWFWDGISTAWVNRSRSWATDEHAYQQAIDILDNDIHAISDDGIEADHVFSNVRVMGNRIRNAHAGISVQDASSGPTYVFDNVVANTVVPWKFFGSPAGIRMRGNWSAGRFYGFDPRPPELPGAVIEDNVFLGRRAAMRFGGGATDVVLDGNAYGSLREESLVLWSEDGGQTWDRISSLAELAARTGHESRGRELSESERGFDLSTLVAGVTVGPEEIPSARTTSSTLGAEEGPETLAVRPVRWYEARERSDLGTWQKVVRFIDVHNIRASTQLLTAWFVGAAMGALVVVGARRLRRRVRRRERG